MLKGVQELGSPQLGGGLVTYPNFFAMQPTQTPDSMDVKFLVGNSLEKRLGTQTMNTVVLESTAGWGVFDYGAGTGADGKPLRWLIVAAGTGVYASSNRGVTFVAIATDRGANYQQFDRAGPILLAVSETGNRVLYWAGSVGTSMIGMPVNSVPPAKHVVADFQGFTFLMNHSGGSRSIAYADANTVTTNAWNNTFSLPSSLDDEITGGLVLYKKLYAFTRYKLFRISYVGGNPDFGYTEVKAWGAVSATIKKATFPEVGEVIICLGYDKKVRIFDGAEDKVISDQIELNNNISPISMSQIHEDHIQKCYAEVDPLEQVYKLFLVIRPSTEVTHAMCLNLRTGAWYPYRYPQRFMSATMADSGNSRLLLAVAQTGYVHVMDSSNADVATAIPEYYTSPFYYPQNPRAVTKTHTADLYFAATSSGTLFYEDRTDWNSTFTNKDTVSFAGVNTTQIVQVQKTIDVSYTQNVYQFRVSDSASRANPWKLNRVDMLGTNLGYGKA